MRFSFILAIVAFICAMLFKDPMTDNAASLVFFMVALFSGFVGMVNSCSECDKC